LPKFYEFEPLVCYEATLLLGIFEIEDNKIVVNPLIFILIEDITTKKDKNIIST
jgi:hypothetical protein